MSTCKTGDGRPVHALDLCSPCYNRGRRRGLDERGMPPEPIGNGKGGRIPTQRPEDEETYEPDAYDLEQARLRKQERDSEPARRVRAGAAQALHLARCWNSRDRAGTSLLADRIHDVDAVVAALLMAADPAVLAAIAAADEKRETA